jgi:DNA-binding NarL/FixJ family response regulator
MKILLIDDHALFREGVALLLRPLAEDIVVSEAGSCEDAFVLLDREENAGRGSVELILMDLGLPGMSGLEGIAKMRQRCPAAPVVALSSSDDKDTVLQALDAGAMGFIPKSATSAVMVGALKLILANGVYLPPSVFLGGRPSTESRVDPAPPHSVGKRPADLGLTPRQADVLYLILQGKPAKLICRDLDLSASTVKAHTSAVLRALNVTTRTQAVIAASRLGLRFGRGDPAAH